MARRRMRSAQAHKHRSRPQTAAPGKFNISTTPRARPRFVALYSSIAERARPGGVGRRATGPEATSHPKSELADYGYLPTSRKPWNIPAGYARYLSAKSERRRFSSYPDNVHSPSSRRIPPVDWARWTPSALAFRASSPGHVDVRSAPYPAFDTANLP